MAEGHEIAAVVTNPDRPSGRGMKMTPPPVKVRAEELGLDVVQVPRARDPELLSRVQQAGADVAVVVAYGSILPVVLLDAVAGGFVNVHFSLLPEYRGAAPVQRAVMEGRSETGVSIMVLSEGMDEGPVIASESTTIGNDETAGELGERLAVIGGPLLVESLSHYLDGSLVPVPQDDSAASYAAKVTSADARIEWTSTASEIANLVRGTNPQPGAWTTFRNERVKVHRAMVSDGSGAPGSILDDDELVIGTGQGSLVLTEVQPAGKKRMEGSEMKRGLRPMPGERFE